MQLNKHLSQPVMSTYVKSKTYQCYPNSWQNFAHDVYASPAIHIFWMVFILKKQQKFTEETLSDLLNFLFCHLSHRITKPTKWHVPQAKTQVSLGIRPVWSVSAVRLGRCPGWSESSLDTKVILLVLSWDDSFLINSESYIYFLYKEIEDLGHFIWNLRNEPLASFIKFIQNDQEYIILFYCKFTIIRKNFIFANIRNFDPAQIQHSRVIF